jgi:hypothetical protein
LYKPPKNLSLEAYQNPFPRYTAMPVELIIFGFRLPWVALRRFLSQIAQRYQQWLPLRNSLSLSLSLSRFLVAHHAFCK